MSLKEFLLIVARDGYGNPKTVVSRATDGANVITCQTDDWRLIDTFYGGHPYSGQEIAYRHDQAIWAMQYRGWVIDSRLASLVYGFLKQALVAAPADHPWRGPKELVDGDLAYHNHWQGTIDNFDGQETISQNGQEIYHGLYFGGLVDQK